MSDSHRSTATLLAVVGALALFASAAHSASDKVKSACKDDYFRHCSAHALGSDALRQCMRGVGENLSTGCLVALVEDGEITKQDIERHKAKQAEAKSDKPVSDVKPAAEAKPTDNAAAARATATAAPAKPKSTPKVAGGKAAPPVAEAKQKRAKPTTAPAKAAVSTAKAAPPKSIGKPLAKTAAATPPKAIKPAAKQPPPSALSGEGAHLEASAGQRFTHNVCHAKTIAGDPISQTCAIDEKCCFSGFAGKLRCVPQSASCNGS